jgi:hypothetical protein
VVEPKEVSAAHQHAALVRSEPRQPVAAALAHQRGVVALVHGPRKPADAELQGAFRCLLVAPLLSEVCCGLCLVPVAVEGEADLAALLALEGAPAGWEGSQQSTAQHSQAGCRMSLWYRYREEPGIFTGTTCKCVHIPSPLETLAAHLDTSAGHLYKHIQIHQTHADNPQTNSRHTQIDTHWYIW